MKLHWELRLLKLVTTMIFDKVNLDKLSKNSSIKEEYDILNKSENIFLDEGRFDMPKLLKQLYFDLGLILTSRLEF